MSRSKNKHTKANKLPSAIPPKGAKLSAVKQKKVHGFSLSKLSPWIERIMTFLVLFFAVLTFFATREQIKQERINNKRCITISIGNEKLQPEIQSDLLLGIPFPKGNNVNLVKIPIVIMNDSERTVRNVNVVTRFPKMVRPLDLFDFLKLKIEGAMFYASGQTKIHREEIGQYTFSSYTIESLNPHQPFQIDEIIILDKPTEFSDVAKTKDNYSISYHVKYCMNIQILTTGEDMKTEEYNVLLAATDVTDMKALIIEAFERLSNKLQKTMGGKFQVLLWGGKAKTLIAFASIKQLSNFEKGSVNEISIPNNGVSMIGLNPTPLVAIIGWITLGLILFIGGLLVIRRFMKR